MRNQKVCAVFFILIGFVFFQLQGLSQDARSTKVQDEFNVPLDLAWTGGLDAAQFNAVDLNLDGILDLLVFDRRGNRKLCFLNEGVEGEISYTYAPDYAHWLPDFSDWVKFVDYDFDGKMDIFTYSPGYASMMVYRNISDEELKFQRVVYPYLTSFQGGGYVNIFVTNADYPGIVDVDNDGDLDILSFWGLGSFLEMHQNMSMEKYGVPDSLDFMQTTYCWGQFAESDESNQLFLDTCLGSFSAPGDIAPVAERHTGSTLLFTDLTGNGKQDLLLGDVDFPGLFALYNDGSEELAHIGEVDTLFPVEDGAVRLFAMPAASLIDVNNDGLKDLLVGVFDPGLITSNNFQNSWLYLNHGTSEVPQFELETNEFLQDKMIDRGSGAYPVIYDLDDDGLKDLFIGNYGYYAYSYYDNYFLKSVYYARLGYYKNVGTAQSPVFQLWNADFASLSGLELTGLIPTFGDLDGDGDPDMLVGKADGKLLKVLNNGEGNFSLADEYYAAIDVGQYSAPQLYDLDKDGLLDLVVGEQAGNLNYYHNVGTPENPQFEYVTDSLGKVNVTDYNLSYDGYSVPSFFTDQSGETGLLTGSEQGDIFYFKQIDGNLDGKFEPSDHLNVLLDTTDVDFDRGMRTGAAIGGLRGEESLQMIVGNYSGGLELFNGSAGVQSNLNYNYPVITKLSIIPNPAKDVILLDGIKYENIPVQLMAVGMDGKKSNLSAKWMGNTGLQTDVSSLKQGVYLIILTQGDKQYQSKLLVLP